MVKNVINIIAWPLVALFIWYLPKISSFILFLFISHDIPLISNVFIMTLIFSMWVNPLLSILPYCVVVIYRWVTKQPNQNDVFRNSFLYGFGFYIATWIIVYMLPRLGTFSLPEWFYGNAH